MTGQGAYPAFNRDDLVLRPLSEREHLVRLADLLALDAAIEPFEHPDLPALAERMAEARQRGAAVILMMGAHVIKAGLSRFIIDFLRTGAITHLAMNGACAIHDYELALVGATSERVADTIRQGQFGLWTETGRLNEVISAAAREGVGAGEAVGRHIEDEALPHRSVSILGAAHRFGVPATLHVGIGYDIVHEHPNCDGAAWGAASYRDFLAFARAVQALEGGVFLNVGTAVMGPEVYLKALAMARNVAHRRGQAICNFTTAVFDVIPLPGGAAAEPAPDTAAYYFRPLKTILVRTVADGGTSYYFCAHHRRTIPALHRLLRGRVARVARNPCLGSAPVDKQPVPHRPLEDARHPEGEL